MNLSWLTIVVCSTTLYLIYNIGRAIYDAFIHPLARFPGPKLRGASNIPFIWDVLNGSEAQSIEALHEEYGDTVRIKPDGLSFASAQAWRDIYGLRPGKKQMSRDENFDSGSNRGRRVPDIIMSNDADHTRMRRLLNHAFSEAALREQEPLVNSYFDTLIKKLSWKAESVGDNNVNLVQWYNFTTFDIIGDLAFGESFGALENEDYNFWIAQIFQGIKYLRFFLVIRTYPLIALPVSLILKTLPGVKRAWEKHRSYTDEKTARRLDADRTDRKDFMTYILRYNDEKGMSREEILENSSILIIGGSETTATLLSGATYYLLKHPDALQKLTKAVRDAFPFAEDMTFSSLAQVPYLHACIEESLRMYPPVPGLMPRRTGREGDVLNGMFIPGETTVAVHQTSANLSERNFKDAHSFVPERWLGEKRYAEDDRAAMQPFSFGPRNCVGRNLAYAEMNGILARMVWNFDMSLCEESKNWRDQKVFTLWDKPPLMVKLALRNRA